MTHSNATRRYWDGIARDYRREIRISTTDFHYGPLLPGDRELGLLPDVAGSRCLELGCGAAQNSICLARMGARCVATDISESQIRAASALSRREGVAIDLFVSDLDALPLNAGSGFDLVHSVYALPFVERPEQVVRQAATMLRPGGALLVSTAHAAGAGEWLEVDDGEFGMFLASYFRPTPDVRALDSGNGVTSCQAVPPSTVFEWLSAAGLQVVRFLEPEPLPVPTMTEAEIGRRAPYDSPMWREHHAELAATPFVSVFLAQKR